MKSKDVQKSSREYKDTLFRTLFGDKRRFLELYNAVSEENIPADTTVTICQSNSLLARFNDIAAFIGTQLVVFFEQQSTPSKNMLLRLLRYFVDVLYTLVTNLDNIYGNTLVKLPTPRFYILYNGTQKFDVQEMKLSDAYIQKDSEPMLELTAKVININYGSGETALDRSISLQGYSFLVAEIRKNILNGMTRDKAIVAATKFCIKNNVLESFLKDNYWKVIKMLNYEYDAEAEKRVLLREGQRKGLRRGRQEGWNECIDVLTQLLKEGQPLDVAIANAKKAAANISTR